MSYRKYFLLFTALCCWFAIIAQKLLQSANSALSETEGWFRFLTFFTILTNILVAIYASIHLLTPPGRERGFWFRASVQTAIVVYISVVGLIYNLILRQLWQPEGLQLLVDNLLHSLVPVLVIIHWICWVKTRSLSYGQIPAWLIYPAIYLALVLVRGSYAGWYPYPFLNLGEHSVLEVALNCAGVLLAFVTVSLIFVFAGQRKNLPRNASSR